MDKKINESQLQNTLNILLRAYSLSEVCPCELLCSWDSSKSESLWIHYVPTANGNGSTKDARTTVASSEKTNDRDSKMSNMMK